MYLHQGGIWEKSSDTLKITENRPSPKILTHQMGRFLKDLRKSIESWVRVGQFVGLELLSEEIKHSLSPTPGHMTIYPEYQENGLESGRGCS